MTQRTSRRVRELLIQEYQAGTPIKKIVEVTGVSDVTLYHVLRDQGVPRRRRPGARRQDFSRQDLMRIRELRQKSWSKQELCDEFSTSYVRLNRALDAVGLSGRMPRRDKKDRVISKQGYAYVQVDASDPILLSMVAPSQAHNRYLLEHRAVMATALGRALRSDESVHHIDGNRLNNSLSNLQLRSGKHGRGIALQCLACGSSNVEAVALEGVDP
jgi:predicted DNA-binding transcriptional regulator AlpA